MKPLFLLALAILGSIGFAAAQASHSYGTKIGQTYYDLQSRSATGNRLVRLPNGNLAATWNESCNPDSGACTPASPCPYVTLGAGYNFFNGVTWVHGPAGTCDEPGADYGAFSSRVESPEMLVFPSGKEMIIAHSPLVAITRSVAGMGGPSAWSTATQLPISASATPANAWPRAVNVGPTIHLIATCEPCTSSTGVASPIGYYRSSDEGQTWDMVDVKLPGQEPPHFTHIGPEAYAIHANGANVAVVAGAGGNQWAMWKSTNGGDTWTKTAIRSFSHTDTVGIGSAQFAGYHTNDSYHAVLVDANGVAHAWAGYILGGIDKTTTPPSYAVYYPLASEGLWYWNDGPLLGSAPQLIVEEREDLHGPGTALNWIGNGTYTVPPLRSPYGGGLTSMPSAALAPNGDIWVVYSGIVEGTSNTSDSTGQSFRDLYAMGRSQAGNWVGPINIAHHIGVGRTDLEEEVFPSVVKAIGNDHILHILFQHDNEPGMRVRIDNDMETLNSIIYYGFEVPAIPALATTQAMPAHLNNITAYPNPTRGKATVLLELAAEGPVEVQVTNLLGQHVLSPPTARFPAGAARLELDLSAMPAGTYLYTVTAQGYSVTRRLVKE